MTASALLRVASLDSHRKHRRCQTNGGMRYRCLWKLHGREEREAVVAVLAMAGTDTRNPPASPAKSRRVSRRFVRIASRRSFRLLHWQDVLAFAPAQSMRMSQQPRREGARAIAPKLHPSASRLSYTAIQRIRAAIDHHADQVFGLYFPRRAHHGEETHGCRSLRSRNHPACANWTFNHYGRGRARCRPLRSRQHKRRGQGLRRDAVPKALRNVAGGKDRVARLRQAPARIDTCKTGALCYRVMEL